MYIMECTPIVGGNPFASKIIDHQNIHQLEC